MRTSKLSHIILLSVLCFIGIMLYYTMQKQGVSNLALYEIYQTTLQLDVILNVNVRTILFLPIIPIYLYVNKHDNFFIKATLSAMLFIIQTPWLLFTIFFILLNMIAERRSVTVSFLVLSMSYVLSDVFGFSMNIYVFCSVVLYLFVLEKSFLIDVLVSTFLISITNNFDEFLVFYLLLFAVYYLKSLILDRALDIERPVVFLIIMSSINLVIGVMAILYLLLRDYENTNSKNLFNFPVNLFLFSLLVLILKVDSSFLLFISASMIMSLFASSRSNSHVG